MDFFLKSLYLLGLLVAEGLRLPQRIRHRQAWQQQALIQKRLTGLERLLLVLLLLGVWLIPILYVFTPWFAWADYHLPGWAGWLGVAVFVAGLVIRWRAQHDLGRNYSSTLVIWQEHCLVTDGIYRYVRHPIYAALWLWALAQPLLLQNWVAGLAGLVVILPLYWLRVPREEALLLEHFGEPYQLYMRRTGRMIPRRLPKVG